MKRHDKDIQTVLNALNKYKLTRPVSETDRKRLHSSKKRTYKRITKTLGLYSVLHSLFTIIYFNSKKVGIKMFVARIIAGILTTAAISGGIYYLAAKSVEQPVLKKIVQPLVISKPQPKPVTKTAQVNYTIAIQAADSTSVEQKTISKTVRSLQYSLNRLQGKTYAALKPGAKNRYKYALTASLEKMDNSFIVYIKVVDRKNSTIIHVDRAGFTSPAEIDTVCQKLARRVINKIK